jgi:hypothetical protein
MYSSRQAAINGVMAMYRHPEHLCLRTEYLLYSLIEYSDSGRQSVLAKARDVAVPYRDSLMHLCVLVAMNSLHSETESTAGASGMKKKL